MTHLWPETDTFDAGSPDYDSGFLTQYTRVKPVTTDPAFGSGGSGYGLSTNFTVSHQLYDGWGGASNCIPGQTTGSIFIGGWLWRVATTANCEASIGYAMVADSTLIDTSPRDTYMGVGCRISGGTLTSGGTTSQYHNAPSGYYGCLLYSTGGNGYFEIWRVDSGTITRLAMTPTPPAFRTWASIAPRTPRTLRLVCTTNGSGNVELELWSNATRGGAVTLITSAVDSSASKITTAGRAGFFASCERRDSGINAAPTLSFFTAGAANGAADFRDEFERYDNLASLAVSTCMKPGRVLMSSFFRDLWGVSGTNGVLIANTSAGRVAVSTNAAAVDKYFLSQRKASDPLSQSREITLRFAGGSTYPNPCNRYIGVCVRATLKGHTGALASGYVAVAHYDDRNVLGWVRLWRANDLVVEEIGSISGVTFALNTEYQLRIDVTNDAVPSPLSGPVKIKVYLNSSQLALLDQHVKGCSINGVGTVTDASEERIQSGYGEGLYFAGPSGSNRNVACSLWAVGTPLAPVEVPEEAQDSISVPTESDGVTGTLLLPIDWEISEEIDAPGCVVDEFDSDHSRRGVVDTDGFRTTWRVKATSLSEDEALYLDGFWDDHKGAELPFNWTPPDYSAPIVARFVVDALGTAKRGPATFGVGDPVELVLEEVAS